MHALLAKKRGDENRFYGKDLKIQYAPQLESIDDITHKLQWRRDRVAQAQAHAIKPLPKHEAKDEEIKKLEVVLKQSQSLK